MNNRVELNITEEAAEGLINEKSMGAALELVGCKLRPEQYLRDASADAIIIFSNGIGDLNPLYRDQEYTRWTRFGGLIAHPCFPGRITGPAGHTGACPACMASASP